MKRSCGILIKCGKRYLLVHASKKWAPVLIDDGHWGFPKGCVDPGEDDLSTAIREVREETGIDLSLKRNQIEKITEYDSHEKTKRFVVFKYTDKEQVLMNHTFYCDSVFPLENGDLEREVDRYVWVTKKELEELIAISHKKKLFPRKKKE